jgi:hypothetical protein
MPDFELNFNEDDYSIIATTSEASGDQAFGVDANDYIRVKILNQNNKSIGTFYSGSLSTDTVVPGSVSGYTTITPNQFKSYRDPNNNLYIKPNEILSENGLPQGNYKLQVDFLNQYQPASTDVFVLKQISPSRLEVRLKLLDTNITKDSFDIGGDGYTFKDHLGDPYQFNHILYTANGNNIPIVNYTFDKFTDGEANQSIILRLYEPLPTSVTKLSVVTVEREVLITQTQDIYYKSSVIHGSGGGYLDKDSTQSWLGEQGTGGVDFENYNNLTGSLTDSTIINNLITGSSYDYPNLNIDYNSFENHTFFGSAVKKLENFKTKVSTIEDYYSDISSSLYADGGAIDGDSEYLVSRRKKLFNDIQNELNSFTPYEKFLYYDGQLQTTQSAPSLGNNYADSFPMSNGIIDNNSWIDDGIVTGDNPNGTEITNHDGFNIVYKSTDVDIASGEVGLFKGKYFAHEKPFFNYSGSVYLSFLLKGTTDVNVITGNNNKFTNQNGLGVPIPQDALYKNSIQDPTPAVDEYRRWIFQASQSYWIPNKGSNDFDELVEGDFVAGSATVTILQSNVKTGSYQISDTENSYPTTVEFSGSSGTSFYGATLPAGDLFKVYYIPGGDDDRKVYLTDIKITLNDPTDTLPFAQGYKTDSSTWTDWYNTIYSQAETFDDENIHSFNNNIPLYIKESSEYGDLKTFLDMNGEHYDMIRNHIDNYSSVYNRGYNEVDSVPTNLMPMLADNLGWELITPFTGSLAQIFNSSVSSTTTTDDIRHNTWRKSLNNLIYLYKSKGTNNAVRALLNVYGYPPDVLGISEFGGSSEEQNPSTITNDFNAMVGGMARRTGNVSFVLNKKKLFNYGFNSTPERILTLDWWKDNADVNTLEFIYKHKTSTIEQEIFMSSGSGDQTLWDLKLQSSASLHRFQFRLNNSNTGSATIASNAVSMSTGYLSMNNGELWNVMLQRMTASISGSGVQEYKLAAALQDVDKISVLNTISMSISGGITNTYITGGDAMTGSVGGRGYFANQNWPSSGSRHTLSSSNLLVGRTLSGSLAEIRGWSTALSASKFKQHTLNKFSVVGNTIKSHKQDLIYHFRLNENHTSSSIGTSSTIDIKDANPNGPKDNPTDYSFTMSSDIVSGSIVYGFDIIDTYGLVIRTDSYNQRESNKIIINPIGSFSGLNLNSRKASVLPLSHENSPAKRINSNKLEIGSSPTNFINNFIINNIADASILQSYTKPSDRYESSYADLDTFRNDFFENYNITIDTNKFIRAHENIWNKSVITGISSIVPARSTLTDSSVGIIIKPHLLEHQKVEKEKQKIQYGETGLFSSELTGKTADLSTILYDYKSDYNISETFEASKDVLIDINEKTSLAESSYEQSQDTEINIDTLITETLTVEATKDTEIDIDNQITKEVTYEASKDTEIDIDTVVTEEMFHEASKDTEIDIDTVVTEEMFHEASKNTEIDIDALGTEEMSYEVTKDTEIDIDTLGTEEMSYEASKDIEIDITDNVTEQFSYEVSKDVEIDIDNQITKEVDYIDTKNTEIDIDNQITKEVDYIDTKNTEIDIDESISKEVDYITSKDTEIDIDESISKEVDYIDTKNTEIDIDESISKEANYIVPKEIEIDNRTTITEEMEYGVTRNINISTLQTTVGSITVPVTGSNIEYHSTNWNKTFRNLHNEWGTGIEDTHFLNNAAENESGSLGDYNVGHIEDRFVFTMIGDVEVVSSSFHSPEGYNPEWQIDFANADNFLNREIRDKGKGYTYNSYTNGNPGPQDGRPVGKTAYFSSSADGRILHIPSNHYSKFSYPFKDTMYAGTLNTNPGFWPSRDYEDYSSASFYRVKVAFEHGIRVERGKLNKNDNDLLTND